MRERRDWSKIDPVQYFNDEYKGKILTRKQLQIKDSVVYNMLRKLGKLDDVLPNSNQKDRDWSRIDPVQYFNDMYKGKIRTRRELRGADIGLHQKLSMLGKLDEVFAPNAPRRDWSKIDPVQYFNEKYKGKIITRKQLEEDDCGLYSKLLKLCKLDEVFPLVDQRSQLENLLQDYVGDV